MSEQSVLEAVPRQLYIGGKWRDGSDGGSIEVEDPATEEVLVSVADASGSDASDALAACADAQAEWQHTPPRERGEILRRAYEVITDRVRRYTLVGVNNGFAALPVRPRYPDGTRRPVD